MKIMNKAIRLLETSLLSIFLLMNFSCMLFENDVADFMEKYTERAAVEEHYFSIEPYFDKDENKCINSKQDFEIQLIMRNPKQFTLIPSVEFENLSPSVDVSRVSIVQDSLYSLSLKFPQEFLIDADEGKDITANIILHEPMSGRDFIGYDIPLFCNTIPPQVQNATILNDNNESFVIFFDMPDAEELGVRHKDIACLTINDAEYPVTINADGSFSFEDTRFSNTPKSTYSIIDQKDCSDSNRSVYFETGDPFQNGEKQYILGLKDRGGLTQTVITNTEIERLSRPEVKDLDNTIYRTGANEMVAGSELDPYKLTLTPPTTDHKGNALNGQPTLHYALYKGTSTVSALIQEVSSTEPVTLDLAEGTYYLETYATLINYEQSALTRITLRVVDSAIFVSEDGDDATADGTRDLPFKTLQAAIADVDNRNMPNAKLSIYISGTLTGTTTVNPTKARDLTIATRPGSTAIIDAQNTGSALTIDTTIPIILKNITIKNGNATNGGAVLLKSGTELTLDSGTTLINNTATNNGGAVYVPAGAKLSVCDGATIKENTAAGNGGAIYTATNIYLSGAIEITENKDSSNAASNIYLPSGILLKITDSLSSNGKNSRIGITTQNNPTILTPIQITQGYGYSSGNNNAVIPGTYFTGDRYAISLDSATGEAVVAVNGGSITDVLSSQEITFAIERNWFDAGAASEAARTLKINPTIKVQGTDVTQDVLASTTNPVIWKAELYINGHLVPGCSFTSLEFVIPQSVGYKDVYTLHVQATWNGMTYDDEITVYGYDPS